MKNASQRTRSSLATRVVAGSATPCATTTTARRSTWRTSRSLAADRDRDFHVDEWLSLSDIHFLYIAMFEFLSLKCSI